MSLSCFSRVVMTASMLLRMRLWVARWRRFFFLDQAVEGIGLGVLLEGFGEAFGLQRRHDAHGDLGIGAVDGGVEFQSSGVFHDDQGDEVLSAEFHEALPAWVVVGKVGLEDHLVSGPEDGQVQAFLAHVETRVGRE